MAGESVRVLAANRKPNYHTEIRTDTGHVFVADEPESLGGRDGGPTPVELFLAGLASCKAITARMYADRKGWALEEALCTIEQTAREPEGGGRPVPHLAIQMQFTGDLDDTQLARLKEIAEKCPVQRMITGECIVETSLVKEE